MYFLSPALFAYIRKRKWHFMKYVIRINPNQTKVVRRSNFFIQHRGCANYTSREENTKRKEKTSRLNQDDHICTEGKREIRESDIPINNAHVHRKKESESRFASKISKDLLVMSSSRIRAINISRCFSLAKFKHSKVILLFSSEKFFSSIFIANQLTTNFVFRYHIRTTLLQKDLVYCLLTLRKNTKSLNYFLGKCQKSRNKITLDNSLKNL